jgi:uncharacterized protein DUF4258
VHGRILKRIRELVRRRRYVMTTHADEEADEDGLSVLDIGSVILTGAIVERQKDRETHEWKYVLRGQTLDGQDAFVVAKFGLVGSLYILTVYEE